MSNNNRELIIYSLLDDAYNHKLDETGYSTHGHNCINENDKYNAKENNASLLYGEISFNGVTCIMDRKHLNVFNASNIIDLGCGTGKLCLQVLLQFKNILNVYGIELSLSRFNIGKKALLQLTNKYPGVFQVLKLKDKIISVGIKDSTKGEDMLEVLINYLKYKSLSENINDSMNTHGIYDKDNSISNNRIITLECGNLFDVEDITSDITLFETDIPDDLYQQIPKIINKLKIGGRIISYLDLIKCYNDIGKTIPYPIRQLESNISNKDRFKTSWAPKGGHHFYMYEKISSN